MRKEGVTEGEVRRGGATGKEREREKARKTIEGRRGLRGKKLLLNSVLDAFITRRNRKINKSTKEENINRERLVWMRKMNVGE